MADPTWDDQYDYSKSPEDNGFTRTIYKKDKSPTGKDPVVTETKTGPSANRKVEVDSTDGNVIFIAENPSGMDEDTGVTVDAMVSVTGVGHAGVELTFRNTAILIDIWESNVQIYCPKGRSTVPWTHQDIATASNAKAIFRITYKKSEGVALYRNGLHLFGPTKTPQIPKPYNRILWWGEDGGTQTFHDLKYYFKGVSAP
jgi:hypothetical protein